MIRMSYNKKSPRRNYGDSSQLNNLILDSGATFNMTPEIAHFILGSLAETDKYFKVADGHFVTTKRIRQFKIEMRDENGKPIIATLYKVLLAPDLCD